MNYGQEKLANAGVASSPPTAPAITSAISELNNTHGILHDRITALLQRLEPILAPEPPRPVGNETGKMARHSLALQIESEIGAARIAVERLDAIISRLEL